MLGRGVLEERICAGRGDLGGAFVWGGDEEVRVRPRLSHCVCIYIYCG